LKWFASAALALGIVAVVQYVLQVLSPGLLAPGTWLRILLFQIIDPVLFAAFPVAAGTAIVKHRLYDIDRLLNRTLSYVGLTAGLALIYWASVVALQHVLQPVVGESELAIVGSTLTVAALFQPMRWRIQALVDRRFYRKRCDANRTLGEFSVCARDEVDLDALTARLRTTAVETVQPVSIGLWLRWAP